MRRSGLSFPWHLFFPSQFPAWCMLACGLIVSCALSFWTYRHEQRDAQASFELERHAQSRGAVVQQGVTNHRVSAEPIQFFATHASALLTLLTGLLTTFAASAYLRSVALRTQRIQQLVAQRTDELKQVNHLLIEDIKARKQVEQALIRSEEHARELADLSSDWFWEQDEHFRYISTDMTGQGGSLPPGILGATRWELSVDPDTSDWPAHRALLEAHQPFKNFEFKALIDGTPIRWISSSGKPVFDADGHFKGYRGTARNISDRKEAEEALHRSRSQLRKLADHQERVREDERTRIARDIHDELGQNLLALRLDVSVMAAQTGVVAVTKEQSEAMLNQIDTTIKSVKAIINDLRPAVLNLGLHAAVEWQAKEFARRSGIACDLHIDHDEFAIEDKRATALFRIMQEMLTNIVRHAAASRVEIAIKRKDDRFFMTIADDGIGLFAGSRRKENVFGMVGIEERIDALGGTISIASDPGQGTAITVSIPI